MTGSPQTRLNGLNFHTLNPERLVMLASGLSVCVALVLVLVKLYALILSGSLSVMASMTDSGLDLIASLITFFAVRYAKTPPDKEHPFGHGKAEAFSALFQAGLVFFSAALVMQDCVRHILHPEPLQHTGLAIAVLLISIVLTLGLVAVQNMALRARQSVAVSADRMHYVTDLITNLIAVMGVVAAILGFAFLDAVAGFVMAGWFVWGAVQVLREAASHLMDEALADEDVARIKALLFADAAILGVHDLRTRLAGPYIIIQAHIEMPPGLNLVEAHHIIITAEKRLLDAYPNADIIIHPDPKGQAEPHSGVFQQEDDAQAVTRFDSSQANKA
ncbi:cation diffusion facilitator family transporter [Asticcacaulis sp. EMRT-3]|uniref:cation diffusion facilitator family transporter n=1 Tax=Asticcacaulis sp. EMRT-3 TaxID=3040349 RepID=UPI0024AF9783|nr:cation diffusion facilitator family transporter [Asticcacaulis sp. EMRT-3]MDI7775588.1 cation diffusion facilitator family transporter [Asticcacaulis sp. EMRT-3]